ncbi:MAG: diaminopimelate epimerase, partial [Elusimicrobia bacterium]|nr:diaminopimelate epimerase [Elusimicrobiota bacterium]
SDLKMKLFNMDGSIAEMSGNGIRCMARFAYDKKLIRIKKLSIETLAGIKEIFLETENKKVGNINVNMGIPEFSPEKIPVKVKNKDEVFNHKIVIGSKNFLINCVSMGNPHCVIFLKDSESLKDFPVKKWGPLIENHSIFPNKTNIEFVRIKNSRELDMRVWERGVGETLACGTGTCAAAVCAFKLKKINGDRTDVKLPGGKLNVFWSTRDLNVYLKGEVNYKFDGIYFL